MCRERRRVHAQPRRDRGAVQRRDSQATIRRPRRGRQEGTGLRGTGSASLRRGSRSPRLALSARAPRRTAAGGTARAPGRCHLRRSRRPSRTPVRPGPDPGSAATIERHSLLRTPGQVGRRPPPGEHAGDPLRRDRVVERPALARDRGHRDHLVARAGATLCSVARRFSSGVGGATAVEVEDVEREQRDRPARARRRAARGAPSSSARPARRPRRARRRGPPIGRRPGPPARRSSGSAARDPGRSGRRSGRRRCRALGRADEREDPVAAPGGLEQVVGRVERRPGAGPATSARRRPGSGGSAGSSRQRQLLGAIAADGSPSVPRRSTAIDWPTDAASPIRAPPPGPRSTAAHPAASHPEEPVPRPARPDDLYRLAVPSDPRLSPDGSRVVFTVKRSRRRARTATARRSGRHRSTAASRPAS